MQTTTALFKENLINGVTEPKLSIAGTDYGIDALVTMKTSCHALGDNKLTMGLAVSKEIDVVLYAQSGDIPRMAVLIPRVKTVAKNSTDSEWIQKGYFYTDTREEDTATGQIIIHGYDSMLKAEVSYPSVTHVWPYGDVNVVNEIAAEMGIAVDAKTTALMTAGFNVPFPAQLTMREVLSNIAGLYGGCFVISDTNTLLLRCLWDVSDTAEVAARTAGWDEKPKCSSSTDIPALSACTGVRFLVDDGQEVMLGNETGYVFEINCPWATMENAVFLYNKLLGLVYRPYEMSGALFNPAAEIGDSVIIGKILVESSRNALVLPYWSQSAVDDNNGITRNYLDDGTILFSGEVTTTSTVYSTVRFVKRFTFSEPQESVMVVIETPESFPDRTANRQAYSFLCSYNTDQEGVYATGKFLTSYVVERGRKCFFTVLNPSYGVEWVEISYNYSGGEVLNGLVRPMVYAGDARTAWEPPVGAKVPFLSGLWSYEQNFNSLCRADIAAPHEEEIDHEYPYISRSKRNYERKQRDVIASLNLLTDQLNSIVETVTPTVTESENIINFPLSDQNPYTYGGLTFTYLDDGGIHISGSYGETLSSNKYIAFTLPTYISENVPWVVMVETPVTFPHTNYYNVTLSVLGKVSDNVYDVTKSDMGVVDGLADNTKIYRYIQTTEPTETIRNVVFGLRLNSGGGLIEFDDTIYPQILLGDTVKRWMQPVGSRNNEIDALRSEITQTTEAITSYVEREVANVSASGYNLLGLPYDNYKPGQTYTIADVAITINPDGSITFNGTSSSNAMVTLVSNISKIEFPSGKYTIGFGTDDTSTGMNYYVAKQKAETTQITNILSTAIKNVRTFTWNPDSTYPYFNLRLYFSSGVSFSNFTIYPQLEYGDKLHEWQPVALSAKTTVTETADGLEVEIAKKVGSNEVITKINASAEGITINTNKLNLTGVLTATDVGATGTTVINGSRISGGTITLGGVNNGNGVVRVLDASGNQVFLANNAGMTAIKGTIGGWTIGDSAISWESSDTTKTTVLDGTDGTITVEYSNLFGIVMGVFRNESQRQYYSGLRFFGRDSNFNKSEVARLQAGASSIGQKTLDLALDSRFIIHKQLDYPDMTISDYVIAIYPTSTTVADIYGGVNIYGDLSVTGNKNRVVKTEHYGDRAISAYETAEPYFGDIGQGMTDESGECIVLIEEIFSETVDLDTEYQVFLQKEGPGDIWVQEKAKDHFTVKGTPGLRFAWELKAKQIDHGGKRLKEIPHAENPEA